MKHHNLIGIGLVILVIFGGALWAHNRSINELSKSNTAVSTQSNSIQSSKPVEFDKTQYSNDDPASIWTVVNKLRPLNPLSYAPTDLVTPTMPRRSSGSEMMVRKAAAEALETMSNDAKASGAQLMLASGFRSYTLQVSVYNNEVKAYGQATADRESARPGYSEHQTGLAMDLEPTSRQCELQDCFANTVEGKWLATNAYKYGFLMRYQAGKESITGYKQEPWHFRYIGEELANELHQKNISTLEEFFGLPAAANYR